jgi:hypothetical protein
MGWEGGRGLEPPLLLHPHAHIHVICQKNMSLDVFVCFKWFNKERVDKANGEANDC